MLVFSFHSWPVFKEDDTHCTVSRHIMLASSFHSWTVFKEDDTHCCVVIKVSVSSVNENSKIPSPVFANVPS
jgi:hypothetical protein